MRSLVHVSLFALLAACSDSALTELDGEETSASAMTEGPTSSDEEKNQPTLAQMREAEERARVDLTKLSRVPKVWTLVLSGDIEGLSALGSDFPAAQALVKTVTESRTALTFALKADASHDPTILFQKGSILNRVPLRISFYNANERVMSTRQNPELVTPFLEKMKGLRVDGEKPYDLPFLQIDLHSVFHMDKSGGEWNFPWTPASFQLLGQLPNFTIEQIEWAPAYWGITNAVYGEFLRRLGRAKSVHVSGPVTPEDIQQWPISNQLVRLNINVPTLPTDAVKNILTRYPTLQSLNVNSKGSWSNLVTNWPRSDNLRELTIALKGQLIPAAVTHLVGAYPNLQSLSLYAETLPSNHVMDWSASNSLLELQIDIYGRGGLDPKSIPQIVRLYPRLQKLNVGTMALTHEDVIAWPIPDTITCEIKIESESSDRDLDQLVSKRFRLRKY